MVPEREVNEQVGPVDAGAVRPLALIGPSDQVPPAPEPPHQPWLRGAASIALLRQGPDPALPPRRARAPFLFRHPRRRRLQQLLVRQGAVLPLFGIGPVTLEGQIESRRRATKKLPVISARGEVAPKSQRALEQVSDDISAGEMADLFSANPRPRTRAECEGGVRPCPWVSCRHHLFLDANPQSGSLRLNHPGVQLEDMPATCVLDLADSGPHSLSEVAEFLGITHERVRQIEVDAEASFAAGRAQLIRERRTPGR